MLRQLSTAVLLVVPTATLASAHNLNGAGATFPYPIYSKWFSEYRNASSNVQVNYQAIGSRGGIRQLRSGTVDFGASDGPMTDEQLRQARPVHGQQLDYAPLLASVAQKERAKIKAIKF